MFRGTYSHNVDAKGRMIVPSKFRESLGETFIITKGFGTEAIEKCLYAYCMKAWNELEAKLEKLPSLDPDSRRMVRYITGCAFDVEFDEQGRSLIPPGLREFAGITKEIVSIGLPGRIEIWSRSHWEVYNNEMNFIDDDLSRRMADLGI